ncbi:MAG: hypothetical protein WC314_26675 [Vulcanimicrobiota bacterium]
MKREFNKPIGSLTVKFGVVLTCIYGVTFYLAFKILSSPAYPYRLEIFEHLFARLEVLSAAAGFVLLFLAFVFSEYGPRCLKLFRTIEDKKGYFLVGAVLFLIPATKIVYSHWPLSMDEYAAWFQAHVFAMGRLTADWETNDIFHFFHPGFLGNFFTGVPATGELAARYWPGFSLLMTPFAMIGTDWLLNPLLGVLNLLLIDRICKKLSLDGQTSVWALLFTVASPVFIAYAISYYSWNAHMAANLAFVLLLLDPTPRKAFWAGVVGSLALVLHQPFAHTLFAAPWIVFLLFRHPRSAGTLLLGYLPLSLLVGVGWKIVLMDLYIRAGGIFRGESWDSYGHAFGWGEPHWVGFNFLKLFTWTVPGLPLLACLKEGRQRECSPYPVLMLWSAGLTLAGYVFLTFSQGHGWGNRYFHSAFGVVPILAALAITHPTSERVARARPTVALLAFLSALLLNAVLLFGIRSFIAEHTAQIPPVPGGDGQKVLFLNTRSPYYRPDLIQNHPSLTKPVLIAVSGGRESDAAWVKARFPGASPLSVPTQGPYTVWRLPTQGESR